MTFEGVSLHIKKQLHEIANNDDQAPHLRNLSSADRKILKEVILNTFEDNTDNLQKLKELDGKIKKLKDVPRRENFLKSISRMIGNLFYERISSKNMREIIKKNTFDLDEPTHLDKTKPDYLDIQTMQQFREKIDGARVVGYSSETDKVAIIFNDRNKLDKFFNENLLGKEKIQSSVLNSTTLSISFADYVEIFEKLK